jgi:NAD(P)-dependent dehydrogenase (short-subunit alcohol dehydrogenase family)
MMSRVAIITGGGGVMGSAIAVRLAHDGYQIVLTDIRDAAMRGAAERVQQVGGTVRVTPADVRNRDQMHQVAREVQAQFGQIDLLVNTAGGHTIPVRRLQSSAGTAEDDWEVELLPRLPFHETSPEEWDVELGVNLMGTLNSTYAVLPMLIERRSGVVINIASGHAIKNAPLKHAPTFAVYSAAKAGVIAFTRCIAVELGSYGIRANCVAPGWTVTPWSNLSEEDVERIAADVPLRRMSTGDDVAAAVSFLASTDAGHITGACLTVNGGQILH